MSNALLVLDTPALYYRAFYALPTTLTDRSGTPINAVRGLLDTIATLSQELQTTRIIAALDADWRPAFRTEVLPQYKAQRVRDEQAGTETPEELEPQLPIIRAALDAAGLPLAEVPGTEADDVIASIAQAAPGEIIIVSPDRDLLALLDPERPISLRRPRPKGQWETTVAADLPALYGISGPQQYRELAALRGDPSDGLPGVPGIGEKTAAKLLAGYGGLEPLFRAARAGSKDHGLSDKRRAALLDSEPLVRASLQVMTCRTDLPVAPALAAAEDVSSRLDRQRLAELGTRHAISGAAGRLAAALLGDAGPEAPGPEAPDPSAAGPSTAGPSAAGPVASALPVAPPAVASAAIPADAASAGAAHGWHRGRIWGFDLETTGVQARTARIVTAALVELRSGELIGTRSWLADPGIEIPAAAVAVHGISTERARSEGADRRAVVAELCAAIAEIAAAGELLAGHNIAYDLTVLQSECERLQVSPTVRDIHPPIADTLVLDRQAEKYRRGPRVLAALAQRWGIELIAAHEAGADATAAAAIAVAIAEGHPPIAALSPADLHAAQIGWKAEQAADLQRYLRSARNPRAIVSPAWPFEY